jgi:hypothetical protein
MNQLHYFRNSSAEDVRHGKKWMNVIFSEVNSSVILVKAVSKFIVAGISPQRTGFNPRSFNVGLC